MSFVIDISLFLQFFPKHSNHVQFHLVSRMRLVEINNCIILLM